MLPSFFAWLDAHPAVYWCGGLAATLALLGALAAGWRDRGTPKEGRRYGMGVLLFVFLLAWRWPFLFCAVEYNPDESQFIVGALTLAHDPVFWRAVDGVTSGPLDFYALLPLHLLGLPLDYFGARCTALVLIWLMLVALQRVFRERMPPALAQLAVLPAAVFLAIATDGDFVHYASELVPVALLALAAALAPRHPRAAACVAGCLPWAKLQAVPLAAVLVAWQLGEAWCAPGPAGRRPWRRCATLAGWALAPTLGALAGLLLAGQGGHFFRRYVLQNFVYVGQGLPLGSVIRELARRAQDSGDFVWWAGGAAGFLLVAAAGYALGRRRPSPPFWLALVLAGTAVFCILLPARPSLHYVLFLVVPLTLAAGGALADLWPVARLRGLLAGLLVAWVLLPLGYRLRQPVPGMLGLLAEHWRQPYTPLGAVLRHWHLPGARLALWGWRNSVYVESGLPQATRDAVSQWCILDLPQRDYYRATYLADLRRTRPELFVDAVGPGSTFFRHRASQGHEIFPELAGYIRDNYHLVVDLQVARVYVRRDFLANHPLTPSDLQRLVATGRTEYAEPVPPDASQPAAVPRSRVGDRSVMMIEPPAELLWHVPPGVRSVRVAFGIHPKAYTEGETDGAEFIVESRAPGKPPLQVYHRFLDPHRQVNDRGPQSAEIVLPPGGRPADLIVRTTAGKAGNNAWDWVYLDQVQFARSPFFSPRQFPGFRRIPDEVEADYPYLVRQESDWLLMLPPPTTLTFVLDGHERQLNFAYGLAEGAYTGAGQTDGAIYQVELQRKGEAPQAIFQRRLDPLGNPADRGRQYADLILPPVRAEDRVVLHITAGANSSWDWTYLGALDLR